MVKTLLGKALLAVVIVFLPITIIFINGYKKSKEHLKKNVLDDFAVIAEAYEGQVYQFFEISKQWVKAFSSDKNLRNLVAMFVNGDESAQDKISDYLSRNKRPLDNSIARISILSLEGKIIASTNSGIVGNDMSNESFFVDGINGINLTARAIQSGTPEIAASIPLMDDSGKKIAVLVNFMQLTELNKVLNGKLKDELRPQSIGGRNRRKTLDIYIVENKSTHMLTDSVFTKNAILKQHVNTLPVQACINSGKGITDFYHDYRGVEVAGASTCIPSMNWTLVVEADSEEVLAPVMEVRRHAIIGTAIMAGIIIMLFLVFFRDIIARLRALSLALSSIADSNYNISVPVNSQDEIGSLSKAFNKMANDIRDRELLIKESEATVRAIIDNSAALIYLKDIKGRFALVNKRFLEVLQLETDEVLGKTDVDLFSDGIASSYMENDFKVLESGMPIEVEEKMLHNDGMHSYISIKFPLFAPNRALYAICSISTDITERKKMEQQLIQSQKMECVGQLAGGISHDFNNILTAILGYGDLLLSARDNDATVKNYAGQIIGLSERAAKLTQGLLAFSRKQVMDPAAVDLNELVHKIEKILHRVIGADIEIKCSYCESDLVVMADSMQIEQVLLNLSTNARDAMPSGGVFYIKTDIVYLGQEFIEFYGYGVKGKFALITVSDTGLGMDEITRKKVFEPFFTTKEVGKGTGLGLSMVYGIIKQHDGFINVYSEIGKGTEFKIYLPLINAEPLKEEKQITDQIKYGTETVLLAEDETEVRKVTKAMLEEFGYKVIEASNGEEAVKLFTEKNKEIDLLIFDMIMPKKNGKEAYKEIDRISPGIKVLFTSGYAAEMMKNKGVLDDGFKFISKPVSLHNLIKKIREVLDSPSPGSIDPV